MMNRPIQQVLCALKKGAADYRYFPEADVPPIIISEEWIEEVRASIPEMPGETSTLCARVRATRI